MFNKIKNIYRIFQQQRKQLNEMHSEINKTKHHLTEIHANILLNGLTANFNCYDAFTTFSMRPSTIVHILNEILIHKRKNIVEMGSGISTLYIARLIHTYKLDVNFFSIDEDESWQISLKKTLKEEGVTDIVQFVHAPLKECNYKFASQTDWYCTDILRKVFRNILIDLLIVDGPKASTIKHARYPAIPFIKDYMDKNMSVFLDDTNRPAEKEIIKEWEAILKQTFTMEKQFSYLTTQKSMSVLPIFNKFKSDFNF